MCVVFLEPPGVRKRNGPASLDVLDQFVLLLHYPNEVGDQFVAAGGERRGFAQLIDGFCNVRTDRGKIGQAASLNLVLGSFERLLAVLMASMNSSVEEPVPSCITPPPERLAQFLTVH